MSTESENEQKDRLLKSVRDLVEQDANLRKQFHIGDKFRFIRDRLNALLSRLEKLLTVEEKKAEEAGVVVGPDEAVVYVYLFNVNGLTFSSWRNMVGKQVFYEYSVNRPIYSEKAHIEELMRTKRSKEQHAYLAVVIKKTEILKPVSETSVKDAVGNPLIKIKEGCLHTEKLLAFVHNGRVYVLDEKNQLVPKHVE